MYVSKKCCELTNVGLLLIGNKEKDTMFLIHFNTFVYNHTLHRGRKVFSCYCLQTFSTEEILKGHVKDWFKISEKKDCNT